MRGLCMLDDRAEEQRRIMDQRAHSNKKLRFRSERKLLPLPPPIFDLSNGLSGHFKVQSDTNL
jgi:hypothetical protein